MRLTWTRRGIAATALIAGVAIAAGTWTEAELGKHEFEEKCASCHGAGGHGDGRAREFLAPADLSHLARSNGGDFPYLHFWAVVDGRYERGATGMPCFADVYAAEAARANVAPPYDAYADARLRAIASYVELLQHR